MTRNAKAYRAAILHSIADPAEVGVERSYEYFEDGLLLVEDGKVARLGDAEALLGEIGDVEVFEYRDALITPGFIDTHIHFPQTGMIASYGEQLLDWLNTYTFPPSANSVTRPMPTRSPRSSCRNCCATALPPRWSSAACTGSRWNRCSRPPGAWTCA
ncbi:amidohydrolase family protein [Pseudomonas aeruginosa]|nr:amidohydrolase family protein [Pseudomonas aeruginosa]